jgi:hypothetical protein
MTDKEIMQQALDTLRGLFGIHSDSGGVAVWRLGGSSAVKDAITVLRSRIEQPVIATEWIGLTDAQIYALAEDGVFLGNVKEIAREIEVKLKELNA